MKAFDEIRRIFADAPLARQRRYTPGTFSFNVAGGRCETCEGAGYLEVEMVFMADVFVPCDDCGGKRFKPEVLDVHVQRQEHLRRARADRRRGDPLLPARGEARPGALAAAAGRTRLSATRPAGDDAVGRRGAAAQDRARAGARREEGRRKLYIMDEPTTGLHLEDIRKLAQVFDRLVDAGHTLVLIEHNLDVIKLADWVIDLGPEAGERGGEVVAMGRPEEVAAVNGLAHRPVAAHSAARIQGIR